jgi:hypothetical protein
MVFVTNVHSSISGGTGRPGRPTVSVRPVVSVPDEARVRDFDQLHPRAMEAFPSLVGNGREQVPHRVAGSLESGEIINFTGYFRVQVEE